MNKSTFMVIALAAGVLIACNGETKQAADPAGHDHGAMTEATEHSSTDSTKSSPPVFKEEALNTAYQHYVHVKTALVNTNATEAVNGAKELSAALANVKEANAPKSAADAIAAANDIEKQRAAFIDLSNGMIALVKSAEFSSGEVYLDHCPMANNDKGASWLSSDKEIANPYFGDKMMKCGYVEETLK